MYTLIVRPDQISVPNNSVGRAPDWRFRGPRFKSLTVPSLFLPSCHNTIVCLKIFMQHVRTTFNKNRHTCERTAIEIDVKGKFFKILSFTQSLSFSLEKYLAEIYHAEFWHIFSIWKSVWRACTVSQHNHPGLLLYKILKRKIF